MIGEKDVARLDEGDLLRPKRAAFVLPPQRIYLDGNSLGALSEASAQRVMATLRQQWGHDLIGSWNTHGWIDLPRVVGEKIAPLIGAGTGQVICTDSISVNLFKTLSASLALRPGRHVVLSAAGNFPTDLYMVQGLSRQVSAARCELREVEEDALAGAVDEQVAVVLLSHVNFRSGRILPMREITAAAHAAGALVIWDLAHSAGALPVALDACCADFAVGCGYKYLNGGPGAPAFVYAARRHHDDVQQPLSGWMGHRSPFAFDPQYEPAPGMAQFLCGTPPILSLAALDAALDQFADVDMEQLRNKSMALGELFVACVEQSELATQLRLSSPSRADLRGSQLSWSQPQAFGISQALIARGVIADFREPDLLRFGFAPLYNSYRDVWVAVEHLRAVVAGGEHLDSRWQTRGVVT